MSRELLNMLFVMTPGAFARLDGDTVRVEADGQKLLQAPLLHLGAMVLFEGVSLTPQLLMRCAEGGREITFLDFAGRFRARVVGPESGNVLLRNKDAADAAVATILALNVTDHGQCSIGGEAPMILFDAKRQETKVLCGQGAAPL